MRMELQMPLSRLALTSCEWLHVGCGHPRIADRSRGRLVNAFGFWQGQEISNASATYFDDIFQAFNHIQELSGSDTKPELWNGETGWPTDGKSTFHNLHAFGQASLLYHVLVGRIANASS